MYIRQYLLHCRLELVETLCPDKLVRGVCLRLHYLPTLLGVRKHPRVALTLVAQTAQVLTDCTVSHFGVRESIA